MNLAALFAADPLLLLLLQLALFGSLTAGAFVLLLRRCRAPALRHALARAGLLVLLLLPFSVVLAHGSGSGVALLSPPVAAVPLASGLPAVPPPAVQSAAPATQTKAQTELVPAQSAPSQQRQRLAAPPAAPSLPTPGFVLLLAWSTISLLLLLRELRRGLRLCATVRAAAAVDAALAHRITALAHAMRLPHPPRLAAIAALPCPATFGLLRPTLLLPPALLESRDDDAITAILRHELAHLRLGHHREGALQLLARCLFAWLPWAHTLCRELGQAQEQLADNVAVAGTSSPVAYARTLLALAERATQPSSPAPLLLSSLGNHELHDRVTRLLSGDFDMNHRPSRTGRIAAAATLLLACAAPFPFRLLPAQIAPPPPPRPMQQSAALPTEVPGPNSGAHFLPLLDDTTWTWHVTRKDGDQRSERDETSRVWGMVPATDGKPVAQVQTTRGAYVNWDYLAARNDGVFTYRNAYLGGMRGVTNIDERLLPAPVGALTQWEWDEQLSYQTMGNAPQPDPEAMRVHHLAKLLAVDETVTVPAGTYKAVHVQIHATGANVYTRDLWFARDVGIVKDEHTGKETHQLRELTAFAIGSKVAFDAEAALQAHCKATPALATAAVEWIPRGEETCYLRGRFAILRAGDTATCAHVQPKGVVTFAPDDKAYWTGQLAVLAADRTAATANQQRQSPTDDMQLTYFAGLAARLQALLQHCTDVKAGGAQTEQQLGAKSSSTCTVTLHAKDAGGQPVLLRAQMHVEGNAVTTMQIEITAEAARGK